MKTSKIWRVSVATQNQSLTFAHCYLDDDSYFYSLNVAFNVLKADRMVAFEL